jgi:hypothetical protein
MPFGFGLTDLPPVPGAVNPAVTQADINSTICVSGWTATVRPPESYTEPIKLRLMAAAGIPATDASLLELDHRIPLEAGGDPRSLSQFWLQPWAGSHGATAKDTLENDVHRDICDGRMTLAQGQAFFQGDFWTAVLP